MTGRRTAGPARRNWWSLRVDQWPSAHQEAWQEANRRDSPVRRGGPAASLALATRKTMVAIYRQYLWWLQQTGRLNPDGDPASQMSGDLLIAFTAARRGSVSDNTTYNNLRMLAMMMNCLARGQDWKMDLATARGSASVGSTGSASSTPVVFPGTADAPAAVSHA